MSDPKSSSKNVKRKTLEYLIEFILVVLGISIAFWLGERSDQNKEKELEQEYLNNLLVDLQADVDLIDYLTVLNEGRVEILKGVESFTQGESAGLSLDSVPGLIMEMNDLDFFYPNNFTYVSLQQSGDFKIIQSHEIRGLLVKLYSSYETIDHEQVSLVNSLENNFLPEFYKSYVVASDRVVDRGYFKSPELSNYVGFCMKKLNTISIYFDRSKILAEQAIQAITAQIK